MDRAQLIHELSLIHAQEKYHEFFMAVPPENRGSFSEHKDLQELLHFYYTAKGYFEEHLED